MVRILLLLASAAMVASGATPKIRLSQKDAAELVLKQGQAAANVNMTFVQTRLAPATARSAYDWKLLAEAGYEFDKSSQFSPQTRAGSTYKRYRTSASLNKAFTTGTQVALEYNRLSQNADYNLLTNVNAESNLLPRQTQDLFGITLEQSLLYNFFGRADRATVNSADQTFKAGEISRANDLEDVVLETIRAYWDAYVAEETFKEALASRERYKSLVAKIKRKSSVGYSNPGELAQAQAEYEGQEQNVKTASTEYLLKVESLMTRLGLPNGTEVEFAVDASIPPVPKMSNVEVEQLREMRAQKLRVDAADNALVASRAKSYPAVNLVGKYYTTGTDITSDSSFSAVSAGNHPKYYAGVKFIYSFGSDLQTEDLINKKVTKELEETRLALKRLERTDSLAQAERTVQSTYAIVLSAQRQKDFREKAVRELTRTYSQGRTEIKILIDAINSQFDTETKLSRALGNYQIALNEWAAARDELIPDLKEEKK